MAETSVIMDFRMNIPENHSLLISLQKVRIRSVCWINKLALCTGNHTLWNSCSGTYPKPELFETDFFEISFFTLSHIKSFRFLFSFHNASALPIQLPGGLWNCSVPYWPDFREHLTCNLHGECVAGEDEAGCYYESGSCGPGLMSAAGGCYKYTQFWNLAFWHQAGATCQSRGGKTVSLNTPHEWAAVTKLMERVPTRHVFVQLRFRNIALPEKYRYIPMWADGTLAYFRHAPNPTTECSSFLLENELEDFILISSIKCSRPYSAGVLCEMETKSSGVATSGVRLPNITSATRPSIPLAQCPAGHVTHTAFACDVRSACWGRGLGSKYKCHAPLSPLPELFACASGVDSVPYSLVCDFWYDCADDTNEDFCIFPPCDIDEVHCENKQCIKAIRECDNVRDCSSGVDENNCLTSDDSDEWGIKDFSKLPMLVYTSSSNHYLHTKVLQTFECNRAHFACTTLQLCLPLELRCNGVNDCPGREDEAVCGTCPGFYRCRDSSVCVHPESLCDGVSNCDRRDDELFCQLSCPESCTCYGLSAYCHRHFSVHELASSARFLEARDSGVSLTGVTNRTLLVYLGLSRCGLQHLEDTYLPNALYLDVRDNLLTGLTRTFLLLLPNLRKLLLDGNPLEAAFLRNDDSGGQRAFPLMETLRLSRVFMEQFNADLLGVFPNLKVLNLSGSGIDRISGAGLAFLTQLTTLDLRGCPMTFIHRDLIGDLDNLETVFADNYKLCCPAALPDGFNLIYCHAPSDQISSCDALLRSNIYRIALSVFAALALMGNLGSFTYRVLVNKSRSDLGFGVFVTHLSVSDLLMGVYLAIIGVADRVYLDNYLWEDLAWRNSITCSVAGFLSFLSNEVSAFIICFITVDRFIVLRFPFSQLRFRHKSANVACGLAWMMGVALATVPLLPATAHWKFYKQNGICLPLPITQNQFPGRSYSLYVMIFLNFALFMLIAVGQGAIYHTVTTKSMSCEATNKTAFVDLTMARRLITVVLSDFLCWFPIGVLGLLALSGTTLSDEVNVAIAILALPFNAAINPMLYTYNVILERRRREKEKRLRKILMAAPQKNPHTLALSGLTSDRTSR